MPDYSGKQFGNYRLLRLLGEGGFAQVYEGTHLYLNTTAAIKVLQANLREKDLQAFLNEARIIANLRHPHIVRVLEFGLYTDRIPFLAMSYAPYGTLRNRHPKGTIVPLASVVPYVQQVAAALQYAHDQRLIHRDVKPENMLLGRDQEVLLSDFGIAVAAHNTLSQSKVNVGGTIFYMAPEQLQGRPRAASDQYSLGVVVYEWLSGTRLFDGTHFLQIASQHLHVPPQPLSERVPSLPSEVEAVVMRALAKEPAARFPTVQAFANALTDASKAYIPLPVSPALSTTLAPVPLDLPSHASSEQSSTVAMAPSTVVSKEGTQQKQHLSRRRMITVLASVTGLSTIGGGIAWFLLTHTQGNVSQGHTTQSTTVPTSPAARPVSPTELPSHPVGTTLLTYSQHTDSITGLTWSPDGGSIASASLDKTVHVWSVTGEQTLMYTDHTDSVLTVAWSPNGQYLASGSKDRTVRVWIAPGLHQGLQGKTGDTLEVYPGRATDVSAVAWSPDSQRIASINDAQAAVGAQMESWDATTGKHALYYPDFAQYVVPAASGPTGAVAWSPNGQYIASSMVTVAVWDAAGETRLLTYSGYQAVMHVVHGLAWSPDGKHIASASDDKLVLVWDSMQGTTLITYAGHSDAVNAVAWSPDGKYIASASRDTTVQIWDAATGKPIYTYQGHPTSVNAVIWAADSKHLASGGDDKTVLIWQGIEIPPLT